MGDRDRPLRLTLPDDHGGRRLDVALAALLGCSRSQAAALIDGGAVRIDGRAPTRSQRVRAGQLVEVTPAAPPDDDPAPPAPPVRYEDDHLLVVAKPAGLVVHPGSGRAGGTLVDALRAAGVPLAAAGGGQRPGIVHRLDRGTSGLLVVAKSDAAHVGLVAMLERRQVARRYVALVEGELAAPSGRIEAPLGRDRDRRRFTVRLDGKPATTHFEVVTTGRVPATMSPLSLLACRLETGRTHQIRVHLSHAGHPIAGDQAYRADRAVAAALGLTRPFLHAASLRFTHPVTAVQVAVTEPLPAELMAALARAGIRPEAADATS